MPWTTTWINLQGIKKKKNPSQVVYCVIPIIKYLKMTNIWKWQSDCFCQGIRDGGEKGWREGDVVIKGWQERIIAILGLFSILTVLVNTQPRTGGKMVQN